MTQKHSHKVVVRAIEYVSDIVEITDQEGRYEYVNRAFVERTGWERDEVLGKTPAQVLRSGVHDTEYYEEIWETISSGETWRGRITSAAKDGSHIIQEAYITPLSDDDGEVSHFIAIKRDITERTQLEAQLVQADRLAAVGQLAAGVGHEINNPLAYILTNLSYMRSRLEELEDEDLSSEFETVIEESLTGARQIRDIVRDLSAMTRPSEHLGPVDVVEALQFALKMVDRKMRDRVELVEDFEQVDEVLANRSHLVQVFLNLIVNAIQAIPKDDQGDPRVVLTVDQEDDEVVITVSDNGCGIPEEELDYIFEPFYSTKDVDEGTGLGLSICYGIVGNLDGEITVESDEGVGTSFDVRLPVEQHASSDRPRALEGA